MLLPSGLPELFPAASSLATFMAGIRVEPVGALDKPVRGVSVPQSRLKILFAWLPGDAD